MNFADFAGTQMYLDSLVVILLVVPTEPFAVTCAPRVTTVGVHIGSSYQRWVYDAERLADAPDNAVTLCVYSVSAK